MKLRTRSALVAFAAIAVTSLFATAATPGSVDPSFNPRRGPLKVTGGRGQRALLQFDGKIVVGGEFTSFNLTSVPPVIRLNPDGSLDQGFDASIIQRPASATTDGEILSAYPLALQNGQTIVGGRFDIANGERRHLIRLNPGGNRDTSFNPQFRLSSTTSSPLVSEAIVQPDGKILVSGVFDSVDAVPNAFLARLHPDGSTDTTFRPNVGGRAGAFALQSDGKIVVAVNFGSSPVIRLNSDGTLDSTFQYQDPQPNQDTYVDRILIQADTKIIVSGSYNELNSFYTYTTRVNANGQLDQSYPLLDGSAVALDADGRLLANLNSYPGGLKRLFMSGIVDTTFKPARGFTASWIVEQPDRRLIVAGAFYPDGGGIARLLPDGTADSSFNTGAGLAYVASIGTQAILLPSGKIVVYGEFDFFDVTPRTKLARLNADGSVDQTFDAGDLLDGGFSDYQASAVVAQADGRILVAYNNELVRLSDSGAVDPTFRYFAAGERHISAMAVTSGDKVFAVTDTQLVRINRNGALDDTFESALLGANVSRIIPQPDGKVLVCESEKVHRLNYDGSVDKGFTSFGAFGLSLLALQPDGKILINRLQSFTSELLRFNADGTRDNSFNSMNTAGPLQVVTDRDGIYVAGGVEPRQSGGLTGYARGVRRLHRDGVPDRAFNVNFARDASIESLLVQVDGRVVVAGDFSRVNAVDRHAIVRLIGTAPDKTANLSTRVRVGAQDAAEIGGFIVTGSQPKTVVIRGLGPSLPLRESLGNPVLDIVNSSGQVIAHNNDWRQSQETEVIATGLAPRRDAEAAIVITLDPGAYTAVLRGAAGGEGTAMVEIYDVDPTADSRLSNISTRGVVQTGDNVMIGGFILRGGENAPVAVRALGPSLAAKGVAAPIEDPVLELHDQSGAIIAANDNWRDEQASTITAAKLAPGDDRESTLIARLAPGAYTAIVRTQSGNPGIGLLEIYDLR